MRLAPVVQRQRAPSAQLHHHPAGAPLLQDRRSTAGRVQVLHLDAGQQRCFGLVGAENIHFEKDLRQSAGRRGGRIQHDAHAGRAGDADCRSDGLIGNLQLDEHGIGRVNDRRRLERRPDERLPRPRHPRAAKDQVHVDRADHDNPF